MMEIMLVRSPCDIWRQRH